MGKGNKKKDLSQATPEPAEYVDKRVIPPDSDSEDEQANRSRTPRQRKRLSVRVATPVETAEQKRQSIRTAAMAFEIFFNWQRFLPPRPRGDLGIPSQQGMNARPNDNCKKEEPKQRDQQKRGK